MIQLLVRLGQFASFVLLTLGTIPQCLLHIRRWGSQLFQVLLGALPLGITAGVALGFVVWMHLRGALVQVAGPGGLQYIPQGLSLAVVLEFGPVSAGLLIAGRTGASLGAELGSMRQTEQLDALTMLGVPILSRIVVPRVIGCMIAVPLLTILIDYLAMGSALVAEIVGGSMTGTQFVRDCIRVLSIRTALPATLKTLVFGFLIGVTGCYCGLTAENGTLGVGKAATRGVVGSTLLVLCADVVLVKAIQLLLG